MKFLSGLICGWWLLGASVTMANATPLTWDIPTLNFIYGSGCEPGGVCSGGTVSGVFTYDADTNTYSAWSIDVSGFSDPVMNGLLTPATSSVASFASSGSLDLSYSSGQSAFEAVFGYYSGVNFISVPLTDSGGDVPGLSFVLLDVPSYTSFNTGALPVVASTSPEPMSAILVVLGDLSLSVFCKMRMCRRTSHR